MSLRFFEFKCKNGHVFAKRVDSEVRSFECECGESANRIISRPSFILDGTDPGFPGAYDKWARDHERAAKPKH